MYTQITSGDGQIPGEEATCPSCGQTFRAKDYGLDGSAVYYCRADDKIWKYSATTGELVVLERYQS